MPFMPYRELTCLDSLGRIPDVLTEKQADSVLLVTDEFLSGTAEFKSLVQSLESKKINCVVYNKTWMDLPMRYQPYNRGIYAKLLHIFLK